MTYADYRLSKAVRALCEANGDCRKWLESAEVLLFLLLNEKDMPAEARELFMDFRAVIREQQAKYHASSFCWSTAEIPDYEIAVWKNRFVDLVTVWPGGKQLFISFSMTGEPPLCIAPVLIDGGSHR